MFYVTRYADYKIHPYAVIDNIAILTVLKTVVIQ